MPLPKVRANQVQWRLAAIFAAVGIPATFVGSAIGDHLPDAAIMIGFAVVMIVAGIRMLRDTGDTGTACKVGNEGINWRRCAPRSIPAGVRASACSPDCSASAADSSSSPLWC